MNIKDFLESMRNLAASVSIVSAQDQQKKNFAMTVSSLTSLSMDPPAILVCVNKEASIHSVLKEGQRRRLTARQLVPFGTPAEIPHGRRLAPGYRQRRH